MKNQKITTCPCGPYTYKSREYLPDFVVLSSLLTNVACNADNTTLHIMIIFFHLIILSMALSKSYFSKMCDDQHNSRCVSKVDEALVMLEKTTGEAGQGVLRKVQTTLKQLRNMMCPKEDDQISTKPSLREVSRPKLNGIAMGLLIKKEYLHHDEFGCNTCWTIPNVCHSQKPTNGKKEGHRIYTCRVNFSVDGTKLQQLIILRCALLDASCRVILVLGTKHHSPRVCCDSWLHAQTG